MSTCRSAPARASRALRRVVFFGGVAPVLTGCHLLGGSCVTDAPSSCPPAPPSYADVEPILGHACVLCHAPDGQQSNVPLDTYDAVFARRDVAEKLVSNCGMPKDGVVLSDDERRTLLTWFVCGAPR